MLLRKLQLLGRAAPPAPPAPPAPAAEPAPDSTPESRADKDVARQAKEVARQAKAVAREAKEAARVSRAEREVFFAAAVRHTPYVAAEVGEMTFVVATWDRLGGGLFTNRRRSEIGLLATTLSLLEDLGLTDAPQERFFVDVGANIGTTTVTALMRHGFGTGLAVEPEPRNVRILRMNVAANDLGERVHVAGCAIGAAAGEVSLVVGDSSGTHRVGGAEDGQQSVVVAQRTLDDVMAGENLDPAAVGLLWIDTQGFEGHVLAGAPGLLAHAPPLVAEVAPNYIALSGGLAPMAAALAASYTHFVDLRSTRTADGEVDLLPADGFEGFVAGYEARHAGFTDILAVRLPAA
jgi:FkbM family methyltransferase